MRDDKMLRFVVPVIAVCAALLSGSSIARAQDAQAPPDQSVADAARQAREQKKNASKPSKVISDDDIDNKNIKPGAEGLNTGVAPILDSQPPSSAAVAGVEATDAAAAAAEKNPPVKAGDDPEIARAKELVVEASAQLDLLKRSFALDQDTYFSRPSYTDDHQGKSKLDAEQSQIDDKQQEIDRLKAHVAELEDALKNKRPAPAAGPAAPDADKPAEAPAAAPPQR